MIRVTVYDSFFRQELYAEAETEAGALDSLASEQDCMPEDLQVMKVEVMS